jgi:hypothetical protein
LPCLSRRGELVLYSMTACLSPHDTVCDWTCIQRQLRITRDWHVAAYSTWTPGIISSAKCKQDRRLPSSDHGRQAFIRIAAHNEAGATTMRCKGSSLVVRADRVHLRATTEVNGTMKQCPCGTSCHLEQQYNVPLPTLAIGKQVKRRMSTGRSVKGTRRQQS